MKLRKKIQIITLLLITAVGFSACGGGGGSDAHFSNAENKEDINIDCKTNPTSTDISNYITINSGDSIVKVDSNAIISIYHDINNVKKVCRVSGESYILRAN